MTLNRFYSTLLATIGNAVFCLVVFGLLVSCEKDDDDAHTGPAAGGYSILVNNENVLVSGFRSEGGLVSTKYWLNGKNADQSQFTELTETQSVFRQAVDENFRTVYTFKSSDGSIQNFQFDQGIKGNNIYYYHDNAMVSLEEDTVGTISTVCFQNGQPYFAGYLEKITSTETREVLRPITPFVWDGSSSKALLSLPQQTSSFKGVSTVYIDANGGFYVGGLCGFPMYWEKSEAVVLDERYGEVWQITKSGSDVYAAGLINKYHSNSTGHTACYWKNGELYELEDRAQAYGIFVDGEDVYVSGAVGNVPASYKPCYWKNGVRVDLPM